jgi:hypothetical protein
MTQITPQQIDRGLTIVETVLELTADVWKHRKQRRLAGRVAGGRATSRKLVTNRRGKARSATTPAAKTAVQ